MTEIFKTALSHLKWVSKPRWKIENPFLWVPWDVAELSRIATSDLFQLLYMQSPCFQSYPPEEIVFFTMTKVLLLEKLVNSGIASVLVSSHFLYPLWVKHWRCYRERNAATFPSERATLLRLQLTGWGPGSVLSSASGFGCLASCFEEDLSHAQSCGSSDHWNLTVQPRLNYLWCHKNTTLEWPS